MTSLRSCGCCGTSTTARSTASGQDFRSRPAFTKQSDYPLINTWAMAACYSANEDGSIDLPFDPATGILRDEVWQRWLAWDPVRMARRHADALRSLRAIYIDAGKKDEFFLDVGAEAFRRELEELGITDVFFELFDAGHGAIDTATRSRSVIGGAAAVTRPIGPPASECYAARS